MCDHTPMQSTNPNKLPTPTLLCAPKIHRCWTSIVAQHYAQHALSQKEHISTSECSENPHLPTALRNTAICHWLRQAIAQHLDYLLGTNSTNARYDEVDKIIPFCTFSPSCVHQEKIVHTRDITGVLDQAANDLNKQTHYQFGGRGIYTKYAWPNKQV